MNPPPRSVLRALFPPGWKPGFYGKPGCLPPRLYTRKAGDYARAMASNYDTTEFVDADFQAHKAPTSSGFANLSPRAPTREEVDLKVTEAQQKLAELKRAQEELERERASLEETRRRQAEFQTGRAEMLQHLARGLILLEKAEFAARQDAEQMKLVLSEFRIATENLEAINEDSWNSDNLNTELSRSLACVENARMEWNAARLRFPLLSGKTPESVEAGAAKQAAVAPMLQSMSLGQLCKLGLALTWPLVLVALGALGLMTFLVLR
jgi:hypothetical protein